MLLEQILPEIRKGRWASCVSHSKLTIRDGVLVDQDQDPVMLISDHILSTEWRLIPPTTERQRLEKAKFLTDKMLARTVRPEILTPELHELSAWLGQEMKELEKNV